MNTRYLDSPLAYILATLIFGGLILGTLISTNSAWGGVGVLIALLALAGIYHITGSRPSPSLNALDLSDDQTEVREVLGIHRNVAS